MFWLIALPFVVEKGWVCPGDQWLWVAPVSDSLAFVVDIHGRLFRCHFPDSTPELIHDKVIPWGVAAAPDGSMIAFVSDDDKPIVISDDGHLLRRFEVSSKPGWPVWVDDSTIAFVQDGHLVVGRNSYPGFENVAHIAHSPESGLFAFCSRTGKSLWIFNPETGLKSEVFADSLGLFGPAWSQTGRWISVERLGPGFWILDAESWQASLVDSGQAGVWWKDYTVFQITHDDGHDITSSKLMIRNTSGQTRVLLSEGVPVFPKVAGNTVFFLDKGRVGFLRLKER